MDKMTKEKYIQEKFNEWEKYYEIPFEKEFYVKALLGLQYDFEALPEDYVKAKKDLIEAMQMIQGNLNLTKKKKINDNEKISLLIVVKNEAQLQDVSELIELMLGSNIEKYYKYKTHTSFVSDSMKVDIYTKSTNLLGKRCHVYWNLTGDIEFENKVLKPTMVIKR
jgi:hypothetical protein